MLSTTDVDRPGVEVSRQVQLVGREHDRELGICLPQSIS
jgi:hypothetical protein